MIRTSSIDTVQRNKLESLIRSGLSKFTYIHDIKFADDMKKTLIYPTNDVQLYEDQFDSLLHTMNTEEQLIVAQVGYNDNLFEKDNVVYLFDRPFTYADYAALNLSSAVIMFSSSYEWIIVIDESLEGGEALFVGTPERVRLFESFYGRTKTDLLQFVRFYLDEAERRKVSLNHLSNMISILQS